MANAQYRACSPVAAEPAPIDLDWSKTALLIIDMQRDFLEPGGFGETLGNDVSQLAARGAPLRRHAARRARCGPAGDAHPRGPPPDLSDAPPAKIARGDPEPRIGDAGPMGRILIRGEAGHDIVPELYPLDGETVIDKPGKGAFYATGLDEILHNHGIENLLVCGVTTEVCVNTTVREANDRGYECVVLSDCCRLLFSGIPRVRPEDDQGPGRHLRLGQRFRTRSLQRWRPRIPPPSQPPLADRRRPVPFAPETPLAVLQNRPQARCTSSISPDRGRA